MGRMDWGQRDATVKRDVVSFKRAKGCTIAKGPGISSIGFGSERLLRRRETSGSGMANFGKERDFLA